MKNYRLTHESRVKKNAGTFFLHFSTIYRLDSTESLRYVVVLSAFFHYMSRLALFLFYLSLPATATNRVSHFPLRPPTISTKQPPPLPNPIWCYSLHYFAIPSAKSNQHVFKHQFKNLLPFSKHTHTH